MTTTLLLYYKNKLIINRLYSTETSYAIKFLG